MTAEAALLSNHDSWHQPAAPSSATTVEPELPLWAMEVADRLGQLLSLQSGWDSYSASPVQVSAVETALELALLLAEPSTPAPQAVPTVTGGVQLEWHCSGIDLEIEVHSRYKFGVYYENARTGEICEADFMADLGQLRDWVRQL